MHGYPLKFTHSQEEKIYNKSKHNTTYKLQQTDFKACKHKPKMLNPICNFLLQAAVQRLLVCINILLTFLLTYLIHLGYIFLIIFAEGKCLLGKNFTSSGMVLMFFMHFY